MSITSERFTDYTQRLLGFWRRFRRSKMGLAGVAIILFFIIMALAAPLVAPWPLPILIGEAPPLAGPIWLKPLDPAGFTLERPIVNPNFDDDASGWDYLEFANTESYQVIANPYFTTDATGWSYTEAGGTFPSAGVYRPSIGFPIALGGSGPGSFEIQYNDTSSGVAYGLTETRFESTFNFNASLYPAGFVDRHPVSVQIRYGLTVLFECSQAELGNSEATFRLAMINSTGDAAFIYNRTYQVALDQAWSFASREMMEADILTTFPGTGPVTLSFQVSFDNPMPQDQPVILFRFDDVKVIIAASYTDTSVNPAMSGQFSATEGNINGSGPGSFQISFRDTDPELAFPNSSAWIEQSFSWDVLNRPQQVFFRYYYKVDVDGDPGDAVLRVIQEMYSENVDQTTVVLKGRSIVDDVPWTLAPSPNMNAFMLSATFDQRGVLHARWRVEVIDPTPEDTPSFTVYIDDSHLDILGNYFGYLGAGQFGEDLLAQLLWGSRIALLVGLTAAAISTFVGLIVGLISGYFGGLIDEVLMRVTDFFLVIPGLPLMIVLAAILSPGWYNIVLVIALVGWTGTARLVRSQVLAERAKAYVEAARAIGGSDIYIIFKHILPNVTPLLFAQITLRVAGAILSEAGLSFLNLTHPYDVSWGRMLYDASTGGAYTRGAWWYVFFPGLFIVLTALSFTLVGYAVDEILNPRLRVRTG